MKPQSREHQPTMVTTLKLSILFEFPFLSTAFLTMAPQKKRLRSNCLIVQHFFSHLQIFNNFFCLFPDYFYAMPILLSSPTFNIFFLCEWFVGLEKKNNDAEKTP